MQTEQELARRRGARPAPEEEPCMGEVGPGWRMGAHPGSRAEPACAPAAMTPGAELPRVPVCAALGEASVP